MKINRTIIILTMVLIALNSYSVSAGISDSITGMAIDTDLCEDGTRAESCSSNKPKYCKQVQCITAPCPPLLMDDCQECSCPAVQCITAPCPSYICQSDGTCSLSECTSDTDCELGYCPDGSTYMKHSCSNNECVEINFIQDPCQVPEPECTTDSDCEIGQCPDESTYKRYSCSNNECVELIFIQDPCQIPEPECTTDSDCEIGQCPDESTYKRYSCSNNECIEINFIQDPCQVPEPECTTDSDCELGTCSDGTTYKRYSCSNNECIEINFIQDPCQVIASAQDTEAEPVPMDLDGDTQGSEDSGDPDRPLVIGKVYSTDVVIKGSKIKENYPDKDHEEWIEILSGVVESEEDLELYAVATAATDENVEEIEITPTEVQMKYKQPAKLFGFIPVTYTATVIVGEEIYPDKYGRVKVKLPWWLAFARDDSKELKAELSENEELANIDLQNALQKQQTLQMISNIMKAKHDTK